jgi:hypothetical protein
LVIACVVAVPLELRLVEERIDQQIAIQERSNNRTAEDRRIGQRDELDAKIARLEQRIDHYQTQIDEWGARMEAEVVGRVRSDSTGKKGEGSAYRAAIEQKQLNQGLLSQVKAELETLRQQRAGLLADIDKEYERQHVDQAHDLVARYEALGVIEHDHPAVTKMTWAIQIVLMLLEAFPALAKLMQTYNGYAALVEAREREDIQRTHSQANRNIRELVDDPDNPNLFVIKQTFIVKEKGRRNGGEDRFAKQQNEKHRI